MAFLSASAIAGMSPAVAMAVFAMMAAAPISIASPSPQRSLSPGGGTPFALCDVWVEHPGFRLMVVKNVQIFPDVVSVQELPLLPQLAGESPDVVVITPQDL